MTDKITYKDAGVDVELAEKVISSLDDRIRSTFRPEVIGKTGGFAALFRLARPDFSNPVLVSATDGVGTKLKIAFLTGVHDTVGIDLVAMNVNDLLVTGAEPLFFLDYLATGAIVPETVKSVISGIATGCEIAGCSLIGGETAEMPDFYASGEYDLAGFSVGVVDEPNILDGSGIRVGDVVLGVASSGVHSNGFSLVRKVLFEKKGYTVESHMSELGKSLGAELLTPTAIYVKPVLELLTKTGVSGMAHITGGGFPGNIPRVLPETCAVSIRKGSWEIPPIFDILRHEAGLDDDEMFRTFNMGVGMVVMVSSSHVDTAMECLRAHNANGWIIGEVVSRPSGGQSIAID